MTFKIEDLPLDFKTVAPVPLRDEFWNTVRILEVGQSFTVERSDSNLRNGLRIAEVLLQREYTTRKEGTGRRIFRTQ